MSPTTRNARARGPRERRHPRPLALGPERQRAHRLGRGLPRRRPLPARGRARPGPRRLLPPLRLRGVNSKEERTMLRSTHNTQSHNLAARMGRWSAAHWKTATFGWLAFVLVAFGLGGMVGTRNIDERRRAGRVRPHGPDPRGRLQAARLRARPDPEPLGPRRHGRLRLRDRGRRRARLEDRGRPERPLAARARQRGPDLEGRALRARRVPDPRRQGRRRSTRSTRSSTPSPPRNAPIRASRSASSATRARRRGS